MTGYTFYVDSGSFGNSKSNDILDYIEELYDIVSSAEETEAFVHERPSEWYYGQTSDGQDIPQIIYSCPDYRVISVVNTIEQRLTAAPQRFTEPAEMDAVYPATHNAFVGISYPPEQRTPRHLVSRADKEDYIKANPLQIPVPDFWENREELFPRIKFCGVDEGLITGATHRNYFESTFKKIEKFCEEVWTEGNFRIETFKKRCVASASDESDTVYDDPKLKAMRMSTIPGKGRQFWPYHLKHGSIRMHIWPDNATRDIYVTYTGPHLPTKKF